MVMDPRLPESYKPNEPVVGFDSFTVPLLSIEPDALNNMPMNSTENPDGESVFPAEPDRVCFHPSVRVGTDFNVGREWGSSLDDSASSDPVLKYISQMLMEENMEETASMSPDCLALQNMEKSLHDTLADWCPDLPDKFDNFDTGQLIGGRNSSLFGSSSKKNDVGAIVATTSCNNSIDPNWLRDPLDHSQTITSVVHPVDQAPQLNLNDSSPFYASSLSNSIDDTNRLVQSPFVVKNKNVFNDNVFNEYLLDETDEKDSPRDAMLDLIRRIKPDVFVHRVTNGSYSAPFFVTRFRETLFHMSSIYDMLDATVPVEHKDSKARTVLESELYGQEIMNVVACEGSERVVRPETYKQWQVRHEKAGFRHLPRDRETMQEFRHKLEAWYHEDFVLDVDGDWMLMGWKGRILYAISCWVPI